MSIVAVYNMKGGVGKTTTAVNLSYLAAAGGQRALLWDLDPQAASSFAFRVRPHVAGFGKKSLESGDALAAAIKETDYDNLDLLPADFAYRKLDRLLGEFGKPAHVVTALLGTLARDYDVVFLDCAAGFSLITEGIFAAADAVLVPTIPTVLSLRMVARVIKWAARSDSPSELAAFFSMVDRRKALHRRACDWPADLAEVFLRGQIPYASVVEQMSVRRAPLPVFAARDPATSAFAGIWAELQTRLQQRGQPGSRPRDWWVLQLRAIETLIVQLESPCGQEVGVSSLGPAVTREGQRARWRGELERSQPSAPAGDPAIGSALDMNSSGGDVHFVHSFDTDARDLQLRGFALELREYTRSLFVVAARTGVEEWSDTPKRAEAARIDRSWAVEILSGLMSPLAALERRLGTPKPGLVEKISAVVGGQKLRRVGSRAVSRCSAESGQRFVADAAAASSGMRLSS